MKRNFSFQKKENIYSVLDIYEYANQLFIDNLSGTKKLSELLSSPIIEIINNDNNIFNLREEFSKILKKFINKYSRNRN